MISIKFDEITGKIDPRFIALGKPWGELSAYERRIFRSKIRHTRKSKLRSRWATLGWSNDMPFEPKGEITFSEIGNFDSKAATLKEVKHIYQFNPEARGKAFVKERFICFDRVDFAFDKQTFHISELPELRLTLFLNPEEGAVVFYQFNDKGQHFDPKADISYILPESTGPDHDTERDRLHYHFLIIPNQCIENQSADCTYLRKENRSSPTSFVVKILTYKRHALKADELLREGLSHLRIGKANAAAKKAPEQYALLKFSSDRNTFHKIDGGEIDFQAKTLFLFHGTFSDTQGSFGELYGSEQGGDTFLKSLMEQGAYQQILAFDHASIIHDAFTNCTHLYNHLAGNRFSRPVDLLGSSRGAIVCHCLAMDARNVYFECGKVLSVSGGFGVGYFTFGRGVSAFLRLARKLLPGAGVFVTMVAQFSVDFFLKQPGARQLTPGSIRLRSIIETQPLLETTVYLNIQADWERRLLEKYFKRIAMVLVDAAAGLALGKMHDLVVGYEAQGISPVGQSKSPVHITSAHTKHFEPRFPKPEIRPIMTDFLMGEYSPA